MYTYIVAYRHGRGGGHVGGLRGQDDVCEDAVLVDDLLHHVAGRHLHGHGQRRPVVGHHPHRGWTCRGREGRQLEMDDYNMPL